MGEPIGTTELVQQIQSARVNGIEAIDAARESTALFVRAKKDYEAAYAHAFIEAKKQGHTDELAKQEALLKTSEERSCLDELTETKRLDREVVRTWEGVLEALKASAYLLNREMRMEGAVA